MLPPGFDMPRVQADVAWLVDEVGPRPVGSAAAGRAAAGVADRLRGAGWDPQAVGLSGNLLSCRGAGRRLFLAHTDTVHASPGAVDNAAGVAILLELARTSPDPDLCLGFPVAEEVGLVGSTLMAEDRRWWVGGRPPALVVSLDLVGQPATFAMGFGPAWSPEGLAALAAAADLDAPFAYQLYSRLLPWAERSDHAPFADRGIPSLLLFGGTDGRVFPAYHQPTDTTVDPAGLAEVAGLLGALSAVTMPAPRPPEAHAAALIAGRYLPPAGSYLLLGAGLLSGLADLRAQARALPGALGKGLLAALLAAAVFALVNALPVGSIDPAEATAAAVMGIPRSGWWVRLPSAWMLGLVAFLGLRRALKPQASAPLLSALLLVPAAWVDPLLGLPFAAGALLGRLHPLLAALPIGLLLHPGALREAAFHGLLPPEALGLVALLAIPAVGGYHPPPRPR